VQAHPTNRGVALFEDKVYVATVDAHVVALDARTGKVVWDTAAGEYKNGYYFTLAPLIAKGKVMVGTSGGEFGIRGYIAALDAQTGKEVWRTHMIPGPGEPGNETWPGETWKTGGVSVWITGHYDPQLGLAYWGTGNAGPWPADMHTGDNLYATSVVALDVDTGKIRGHHFGEGKYARSERTIRQLLMEAGAKNLPEPLDEAAGEGISAASDSANVGSPETYVGFERAANFASPGSFARDAVKAYELPSAPALNQWGLGGRWKVGGEKAALAGAPGKIVYRFRARDLHLVLGPAKDGKPVRFRVTLDGKAPGADHGVDIDAQGNGSVNQQRLYQLIRQKGAVGEHEFVIEFLDPGVEAYSFTFG